jgi:hypothetical protein
VQHPAFHHKVHRFEEKGCDDPQCSWFEVGTHAHDQPRRQRRDLLKHERPCPIEKRARRGLLAIDNFRRERTHDHVQNERAIWFEHFDLQRSDRRNVDALARVQSLPFRTNLVCTVNRAYRIKMGESYAKDPRWLSNAKKSSAGSLIPALLVQFVEEKIAHQEAAQFPTILALLTKGLAASHTLRYKSGGNKPLEPLEVCDACPDYMHG